MRIKMLLLTAVLLINSGACVAAGDQSKPKTGFMAKMRTLGRIAKNGSRALSPSDLELFVSVAVSLIGEFTTASVQCDVGPKLITSGGMGVALGWDSVSTLVNVMKGHHKYAEWMQGQKKKRFYRTDCPELYDQLYESSQSRNPYIIHRATFGKEWKRLLQPLACHILTNVLAPICNRYIDSKVPSMRFLSPFWSRVSTGIRHGVINSVLDSAVLEPMTSFGFDMCSKGPKKNAADTWKSLKKLAREKKSKKIELTGHAV